MPEGVGEAYLGIVSVQQRPQFEKRAAVLTPPATSYDFFYPSSEWLWLRLCIWDTNVIVLKSCRQRCGNHHIWTFENFGLCNSKPTRKSVYNWFDRRRAWNTSANLPERPVLEFGDVSDLYRAYETTFMVGAWEKYRLILDWDAGAACWVEVVARNGTVCQLKNGIWRGSHRSAILSYGGIYATLACQKRLTRRSERTWIAGLDENVLTVCMSRSTWCRRGVCYQKTG